MTKRDAIREFVSYSRENGGFGDYWAMQLQWACYVDNLEREGRITPLQAWSIGNPTTPKGFRRWHLRNFGRYPESVENN